MIRYTDVEFNGKKARLCLTMSVLIQAEEIHDCSFSDYFDEKLTTKDRFYRQIWLISAMSYKGFALYPNEGLAPITIAELEEVYPYELNELLEKMWDAYTKALTQDKPQEEIDLGLIELKKKKTKKHWWQKLSERQSS